jgi:osmotically-inducible protein OsmY
MDLRRNGSAISTRKIKTMKTDIMKSQRGRRQSLRMLALAVAGAMALQAATLAPLQAQEPKEKAITDKDITSAVEERFLFDNAVPWSFIDIKTNEGIVTLSGTVDNLLAKERATKIAESIKGVRSVVNNINVQTVARTDEEIRKDVENALLMDPAADSYEVKTAVNGGVITLSGTVQSFQEKNLAMQLARQVRGVKEVKSDITVKYKTTRPDPEIVADAKRALENDTWIDPSQVKVSATNGKVTLTGSVGSAAEKTRARTLAWVMGVNSVDDQALKVEPWLAKDMRRKPGTANPTDEEIKKAVKDAFVYDPRVFSFNPEVEVSAGVVTLSGIVDNLKARQAAEQDARNTVGVYAVRNHLKVRPVNLPPDDKLAQNVKDALLRDTVVDSFQVDVKAERGTVTLNGTVDSYYEKSHAEDVANRLNGVVSVKNNLDVSYPTVTYHNFRWDPYYAYSPYYYDWVRAPFRSDSEIKKDIEDELFWSPFVDQDEVKVSVDNGVATLTGTVDSWNEFYSATENAREGGATSVINKLNVG